MVARERYSAFGERRRSDNLAITDRLYTGQRLNLISNLYHYTDGSGSGRFYDPLLARFVMADNVTPGKGSQPLNRYAYANDSPIVFSDPTGHAVWSEKDGPDYETHEQLIDAVGAYDTPSEVRWTGIYSEAYPNYAPPMSEPDRNYGYRLKVWQWQTQKEADAAQASGAGADWSKVGSNLLTGVSLAAGVVASNGGDDGSGTGKTGIVLGSKGELSRAGVKDAHHIWQDAAMRELPGYSYDAAPAIQLEGPSTKLGSPHYIATQVQAQAGGGTFASETRIAYKALRQAGLSSEEARAAIEWGKQYFDSLGVTSATQTRIPLNRR